MISPSVLHQLFERGLVADVDREPPEIVEQPRDQRVAHDQARAAPVAQPVEGLPRQQADGMGEIGPGAKRMQQRRDVGLADHHAAEHGEFAPWRPHAVEIGAELAPVKGSGAERAAARAAPGRS